MSRRWQGTEKPSAGEPRSTHKDRQDDMGKIEAGGYKDQLCCDLVQFIVEGLHCGPSRNHNGEVVGGFTKPHCDISSI